MLGGILGVESHVQCGRVYFLLVFEGVVEHEVTATSSAG